MDHATFIASYTLKLGVPSSKAANRSAQSRFKSDANAQNRDYPSTFLQPKRAAWFAIARL
jgi:hypothetical protein